MNKQTCVHICIAALLHNDNQKAVEYEDDLMYI